MSHLSAHRPPLQAIETLDNAATSLLSGSVCDPNPAAKQIAKFPNPLKHPFAALRWILSRAFGLASLTLMLSVVAAIPLLNFFALGCLLEAEARVARSGKLRDAFPLVAIAPRIGAIVMGAGIWVLFLRLFSLYVADAQTIAPASTTTSQLRNLLIILATGIALHLCLALARGGSLGCFFRPFKNVLWLRKRLQSGDYWSYAGEHLGSFIAAFRLKHHFWLGLRGYLGAAIWLFPPTALLAVGDGSGPSTLVSVVGGIWLVFVLSWLPFLQARLAAENRFGAIFEPRRAIECFKRAPFSWALTTILVYALALPLYLLKVRLPPQDAMWLATVVFIVSIYPARILTGLAYGRASRRSKPAWYDLTWLCRTAVLGALLVFVFLLFFTQGIGEHGKRTLFEHHAFLLPWPL
ncbi:MAG: hypothetical protein VX346_01430 [Planctomycetota bacterium]|nr:hypothetical protein [Planctomycetota bacterium]